VGGRGAAVVSGKESHRWTREGGEVKAPKLDYEPVVRRSRPIGAAIAGTVVFGCLIPVMSSLVLDDFRRKDWPGLIFMVLALVIVAAAFGASGARLFRH
jgi:hypothetical protein